MDGRREGKSERRSGGVDIPSYREDVSFSTSLYGFIALDHHLFACTYYILFRNQMVCPNFCSLCPPHAVCFIDHAILYCICRSGICASPGDPPLPENMTDCAHREYFHHNLSSFSCPNRGVSRFFECAVPI